MPIRLLVAEPVRQRVRSTELRAKLIQRAQHQGLGHPAERIR